MAEQTGQGRNLAIVVGGGPAPGINGVIAAVTIAALDRGYNVFGCQHGFSHLVAEETDSVRQLTYQDVYPYALRGGSMLGTARTNPTKKEADMQAVLNSFKTLGITDLVTIGGDDTAYTSSQVKERAGSKMRVVHVPKTIDNDLPLPGTTPTFGYETARHYGTITARAMIEDAETTTRWYILVSMGRAAGHLALGIGRSSAAQLTLIPEEFGEQSLTLERISDAILGSIIKRRADGKNWGVVVLAEGLVEKVGIDGLIAALGSEEELKYYGSSDKDEFGNLRMAEIQFGRLVKDYLTARLAEFGLKVPFVAKDVGYELRCIDPIPFDCEYTRELGFAAVKYLGMSEADSVGAIVSVVGGEMKPLPFKDHLDPKTKKMSTRQVNVKSQAFESALAFMDRLETEDFHDDTQLAKLAKVTHLEPEIFRERFGYLVAE